MSIAPVYSTDRQLIVSFSTEAAHGQFRRSVFTVLLHVVFRMRDWAWGSGVRGGVVGVSCGIIAGDVVLRGRGISSAWFSSVMSITSSVCRVVYGGARLSLLCCELLLLFIVFVRVDPIF